METSQATKRQDLSSLGGELTNNSRIEGALCVRGELAALTEGLRHAIWTELQSSAITAQEALVVAEFLIFHQQLSLETDRMINPEKVLFKDDLPYSSHEFSTGESLAKIKLAHCDSAKVDTMYAKFVRGAQQGRFSEKTVALFGYLSTVFASYRSATSRSDWPQVDCKNIDPISYYAQLGRVLAHQTYVVEENVKSVVKEEAPSIYWPALRNSAFAAAVVISLQNALEASAIISELAPEAAYIVTSLDVKPIGNQMIEVRFDIFHPQWTDQNYAGRAIGDLVQRLSKPGQIILKHTSEEHEPYRYKTAIIAQIKMPE
jgi:hypothetical protein